MAKSDICKNCSVFISPIQYSNVILKKKRNLKSTLNVLRPVHLAYFLFIITDNISLLKLVVARTI